MRVGGNLLWDRAGSDRVRVAKKRELGGRVLV